MEYQSYNLHLHMVKGKLLTNITFYRNRRTPVPEEVNSCSNSQFPQYWTLKTNLWQDSAGERAFYWFCRSTTMCGELEVRLMSYK